MTGLFHRTGRLGFGHTAISWKAARPGPRSGTSPAPPDASAGRNHRLFRQPRRALTASAAALALATGAAAQGLPSAFEEFSLEQTMASSAQTEFPGAEEGRPRAVAPGSGSGSASAILQHGTRNRALTAAIDSRGAVLTSLQSGRLNRSAAAVRNSGAQGQLAGGAIAQAQFGLDGEGGESNRSAARIENSPGSKIAQVQIGSKNTSGVLITGGFNNTASTVQIGNSLALGIVLRESEDTTVVYEQVGSGQQAGALVNDAMGGRLDVENNVVSENTVSPANTVTISDAPPGTTITVGDVTRRVRQ